MKPNVYLRNKGLNFDFKLEGSGFKGTLQNLLKDYKERLILSGVGNHVVCDECGNTGRGRPTLQEPDGVDCEKCSSK